MKKYTSTKQVQAMRVSWLNGNAVSSHKVTKGNPVPPGNKQTLLATDFVTHYIIKVGDWIVFENGNAVAVMSNAEFKAAFK